MKKIYLPLALITLIGANSYLYAQDWLNKSGTTTGQLTVDNCEIDYSKYSNPFRLPSLRFSFQSLTLSKAELLASGVPDRYFSAIDDWKQQKIYVVISDDDVHRQRFKKDWSKFYDKPYYGDETDPILIAAGADFDKLSAQYPKESGYTIVKGHARPSYRPKEHNYYTLSPRYLRLAIPAGLREEVDAFLEMPKRANEPCSPQYNITVKWGSNLNPWIDKVTKIGG